MQLLSNYPAWVIHLIDIKITHHGIMYLAIVNIFYWMPLDALLL